MRIVTIAALLLAAACNQHSVHGDAVSNDAAANANLETPSPEASAEKPVAPLLDGNWQLSEVDGRPVEAGSSTTAAFGGGDLRVTAGCNRRSWTFTQKGNIVAFKANPGGSSNCEKSPNVDQESAFLALDRATMVIFANQGSEASLSGDGGNVTLVRR